MSFVNLHCHSHYSLLDGFGSPEAIVKRAKELGYPGAALTDHGVTYGLIELYNYAKKEGIKPILGCEFYVANRTRFDKEAKVDVKPYHLTVLAANNKGYENLLYLTTKAHLEGFYYKPRIDYDLLKEKNEGLIVLSGCMAAHIPRLILSRNEEELDKLIKWYLEIFGKERFFLEIQDHPLLENQQIVNERLKELAVQYGLDIVATNDSHYPCPEDKDIHDLMLCVQTGTNVNDPNRMKYTGDFSLRDINELKKSFGDYPGALENSLKIAEMCNVDLQFGQNLIPSFDTPENKMADKYLRELCYSGLKERLKGETIPEEYRKRLDYELSIVNKMGFDTYFLIVWDFVKYAKDKGIYVGPGRGSAAGAIIAWSLKITDVDPIAHGLFFERFLNPERVSMPDIDIDFADHRRDEVLQYVVQKYGRDNVAQIITFGTLAPKAAIRDAGRALGFSYSEVDVIAKTVPAPILGKHAPLVESIKEDQELKKLYGSDSRAKMVLDYASRIEGTVRQCGTHACAVIISEKPLTHYTALQYGPSGKGEIVTQFSAKPLEDIGLLKMDFLGLRNLTVIENAINFIKERRGIDIDLENLPFDDTETFKVFQKGDTTGVFQFESPGMRRYLKELIPTEFEDIVAMAALYRPGPMDWIPTYIKGKHNPDKVKYLHKSFKEVLSNTYGVAVYQEQILQIARDFAGFSLGEADILRKAVGKKIPSLLAEQREKFVAGAIKQGHDEKFSNEVFVNVIEPFAGYGFNKAHAVCYGVIAYRTAYLKAHFPVEFMNALLCSDAGNMERIVIEVQECNEMGISVLPPSINESFADFTVVDDQKIRFGLKAIKGIGEGPINAVIDTRLKGGKFSSLSDFARRVPSNILNKKLIESMAYCGALDEFGDRASIANNYDVISKFAKNFQNSASDDQTSIFGMMDEVEEEELKLNAFPQLTMMQQLSLEKDYLGMYVSGHPLKGLKTYISKKADLIANLTKNRIGKEIRIIGMVTELRKMMTKNGSYMAAFVLEDPSAKINVVVFPKTYSQFSDFITNDAILSCSGKFDHRRDVYQLMCNTVKPLSFNTMIQNAKEAGIYDSDEKSDFYIRSIDDILAAPDLETDLFTITIPKKTPPEKLHLLKEVLLNNQGESAVELFFEDSKSKIRLPFTISRSQELDKSIDKVLSIV